MHSSIDDLVNVNRIIVPNCSFRFPFSNLETRFVGMFFTQGTKVTLTTSKSFIN